MLEYDKFFLEQGRKQGNVHENTHKIYLKKTEHRILLQLKVNLISVVQFNTDYTQKKSLSSRQYFL